jgi:CHAD domain-containing protein
MPRRKPGIGARPQPLSADLFAHMVRKGLKRLQKAHEQCQRSANMENVHRMRRAIRHLRTLLDVCRQWEKSDRWRDLHERIRQLLHALGPLRDLQVRIATLRVLVKRHPALSSLLRRAEKEEREERTAVSELMAKMEMQEVGTLRRRIRRRPASGPPRPALMRTIALDSRELGTRWKAMRAKDPRSMHRARVALRRLTHLLTSMAPHLARTAVAPLPALKRMQERLGRAHDMQMLLDWTGTVLMKLPASHRPAIVAFLDRSLHLLDRRVASFLREHQEPGI